MTFPDVAEAFEVCWNLVCVFFFYMLVVIDRFLMCFLNCSVPEFIRPSIIFYNVTLLFVRILMYIIKSLTTHQLVLYIDNGIA